MTKISPSGQSYDRRQIVAKMGSAGFFRIAGKTFKIWRYMTFWTGDNSPSFAAEFVGKVDTDRHGLLHVENLSAGQIVVAPGLIYEKIPMTGAIMQAHLYAMRTFKPKGPILKYEKDNAPAIDMGPINLTGRETLQ